MNISYDLFSREVKGTVQAMGEGLKSVDERVKTLKGRRQTR